MSNNSKTGCENIGNGFERVDCNTIANNIMQNYNDEIKNKWINELIKISNDDDDVPQELIEELSNRIFKPISSQQGGKKSKKRKTKKYNRIKKKGKKKSKSKTKKRR